MTMDNEITKFKEQNGNITYSTKELIQALHTKFDGFAKDSAESHEKMKERLSEGEARFSTIEANAKSTNVFLKWFVPLTISTFTGILYLIFTLHGIV